MKQRILNVATRLFADHGFAGTSISAIAREAGVSKALVLYHFESKEMLRSEVFRGLVQNWAEVLPRVLGAVQGDGDPLAAVVHGAMDQMRENPHVARFLMRELLRPDGEVSRMLADRTRPATAMAAAALPNAEDPEAGLLLMGLVLVTIGAVFVVNEDGTLGVEGMGDRVLAQAIGAMRVALGQ